MSHVLQIDKLLESHVRQFDEGSQISHLSPIYTKPTLQMQVFINERFKND